LNAKARKWQGRPLFLKAHTFLIDIKESWPHLFR